MKILIWIVCIIIFEAIKTAYEVSTGTRIYLGAIPTFICASLGFAIVDKICRLWEKYKDRKDEEKNIYNVMIYDVEKAKRYKKKCVINLEKTPIEKYAEENMFYAVEHIRDGKRVRKFYPKDLWEEKVEEFIEILIK